MIETVAMYVIVACAALWVTWAVILPTRIRQTLAETLHLRPRGKKDCGDNCNCGS